jgi:uncharacterized repeat protein (TIGR03803 family)
VIRDSAGNLYGTTSAGGGGFGVLYNSGVVYKLDPAGNETVLHSFTGGADGGGPQAGVIRDSAGNLYGTTQNGGLGNCLVGGCGVVYKLDPAGNETVLYSFSGGADGGNPIAGVMREATTGKLYGTTYSGGKWSTGVVFEIPPTSTE